MKNIESKNRTPEQKANDSTEGSEDKKDVKTSGLKLGDDKQVSRDLTKLYEKDLKF